MGSILKEYKVFLAPNGLDALDIAQEEDLDLILLDIRMPDMDGFEVCKELKKNKQTQNIPIIFLTGLGGVDDEAEGLHLGAVDFITKPYEIKVIRERIHNHLEAKISRDILSQKVGDRTRSLLKERVELGKITQEKDAMVNGMLQFSLTLMNASNPEIAEHSKRVAFFCNKFGKILNLKKEDMSTLHLGALFHDIGKLGFHPEAEEDANKQYAMFMDHPLHGVEMLEGIPLFHDVLDLVRFHHENFDGSGFPEKRKGENISYLVRILSLINAIDGLVYDGREEGKSILPKRIMVTRIEEWLKDEKGIQFDPELVDIFLKHELTAEMVIDPVTTDIRTEEMVVGMTIAEPLIATNGLTIAGPGTLIDDVTMKRIINFRTLYGFAEEYIKVK